MKMKIEILYFADFKDITGIDREFLELNENSIEGLTSQILSKYNTMQNLIWDDKIKSLKKNISIVINDHMVNEKNARKLKLKDGDKVAFLLPFAGG
jgi:MoaD family protein